MGSSPSSQTVTNVTKLPEWVDEAAQQNLDIANKLAEKPYVEYKDPLTADWNATQQQATNLAKQNSGAWLDELGRATSLSTPTAGYAQAMQNAAGMAGLTPGYAGNMSAANSAISNSLNPANAALAQASDVARSGTTYKPRSFLQGDISAYMNPYIDQVENRALDNQGRAFQNNLNSISANAVSAGAFGGSRQGIAEGVAGAENARAMGDLSAQLRAQGFDTAAGLMENDITRDMQGQQMRQAAGQQLAQNAALGSQIGISTGQALGNLSALDQQTRGNVANILSSIAQNQQNTSLQAGQNLANIANTGNQMGNQNAALLAAMGGAEREVSQAKLQENYAKWKEKQDHDLQQLNLRLTAVGATPYGGTQTQTTTGSGGGNTGMSIFGSVLGMMPFLAGLSDRDEKTDIKKVGKDPKTGLDLYAYRYKGDPKSYPKVVGPMAQDIEKKYPAAVREVGNKKVVNFGALGFGGGLKR